MVKNLPAMLETWVRSQGWEDPLEEDMAAHSVFLAGDSRGQRSLADYGPRGLTHLSGYPQHRTYSTRNTATRSLFFFNLAPLPLHIVSQFQHTASLLNS